MPTLSFFNKTNLWRLATEGQRLDGAIPLAQLPRLGLLNHAEGDANIALLAGVDKQGVHYLKGEIQADIELDCQRCLGPLHLPILVKVALGLVRSETEIESLSDAYEPLVATDSGVIIADVVEDELLLALPQIPRHQELWECEANGYAIPGAVAPDERQRQPFAVLASLLPDLKRST